MAQAEHLNAYKVRILIREIRKPKENSKKMTSEERCAQFVCAAETAWSAFDFAGTFCLEYFEAFLLEAIYLKTKVFSSGDTSKASISAARERDSLLLMFGLLQGYYHTEVVGGKRCHVILEDRWERYLNESDFVTLTHLSPKYTNKPGEKLFSLSKGLLIKHDQGATAPEEKDSFVSFLSNHSKEELQQILEDGKKHFLIENDTGRCINYPKPCFTKENFPSAEPVKPPSTSGTTSNPPDPTPTPDLPAKGTHPALLLWSRGLLAVCIILTACLALTVTYLIYSNRAKPLSETVALDRLEVQSIAFVELSELRVLAPGESIVLSVEIDPDEIGPEELDYISDQPKVAYTDKNAVTALPDLPSSIDAVVTITAQKGVVEDKTYIHVLGADSAGIGYGTNATGDGMEGGE